jgi:hypothetical protein
MRTLNRKTGLVVIIMAVCFFATTAMAQVYTDPVGFVKVDVVRDGLTMVSVPLQAADTRLNGDPGCLGDMIKENLTGGTNPAAADTIHVWDAATQSYETYWLLDLPDPGGTYDLNWMLGGAPTDRALSAGEALWIERKSAGDPAETITFLGWVSMEQTKSVTFVNGLTMFAWPFPTTLAVNDSTLGEAATGGTNPAAADNVYEWDETAGTYTSAWLLDLEGNPNDGKWLVGATPTTMAFEPGAAFWFERKSLDPATWLCERPY